MAWSRNVVGLGIILHPEAVKTVKLVEHREGAGAWGEFGMLYITVPI